MAARTVSTNHRAWHGTLTANEEDVVSWNRDLGPVEIFVESGSAPVYYTSDGRAATIPAANTSSASGVVTAGSAVQVDCGGADDSKVRLISAAAAVYHLTDAS